VGIILIYLKKAGHEAAARWVYLGLAAGVAASIVLRLPVRPARSLRRGLRGMADARGALCVAVMVVWMMRSAKTMKQDIETRLGALANESGSSRPGSSSSPS
jgi:high-affinity Fe2+/Pb2+ permease